MKKRKFFSILFLFLLIFSNKAEGQERRNPFSVEWDDSVQKVKPGETFTLRVKFQVPPGHYINYDKTELKLNSTGELQEIRKEIPKPEKHFDVFLKQEIDAYLHDFEIKIFLKVPDKAPLGRTTLEGEVKYQGCSSDFCYRPMKSALLIPLDISLQNQKIESKTAPPQVSSVVKNIQKTSFWQLLQTGQVEEILQTNFLLLLLLSFVGGILTCFTPCVLPIIPLTLAVVGIRKNHSWLHNLGLSICLVLGMSITYALLGLASALLGFKLGFLFQSRLFLVFLILFFIAMSLSLWGFFQLQLPIKARNYFASLGGGGAWGSFLAGLSIGFVASPCVGPLMGPLLLWVATNQKIGEGSLLLFSYGLGMGLLFILMSVFYSSLAGKLRGGKYSNVLKKLLALLMLLPALYYGEVLYHQFKAPELREGWTHSLQEGFAKAQAEHKAVLIDFYADWCLPCIEIDHKTFQNPEVEKALANVVAIKIDCTTETPTCKEAVDKYQVVGWPTILFINSKLENQKDLSVVGGFVGPERMLEILTELKNRSQ